MLLFHSLKPCVFRQYITFFKGFSSWPTFTTFPLLHSLFFTFSTLQDPQKVKNNVEEYSRYFNAFNFKSWKSTDFQDFKSVGLWLRDNRFWLRLMVLVAFEYYSSMDSTCIYVYVPMYATCIQHLTIKWRRHTV